MASHLRLVRHSTKGRVTYTWVVYAAAGGQQLGLVAWWSPWRRYCFFPAHRTVFEQDCMREIATFIEDQTNERRAATKALKEARQRAAGA